MFGFWKKTEKKIERLEEIFYAPPRLSVVISEIKQTLAFGGFVQKTVIVIENINSVKTQRFAEFFETYEAGLYLNSFRTSPRSVELMLRAIIEDLKSKSSKAATEKIQGIVDFLNGKIDHPKPETTHVVEYT